MRMQLQAQAASALVSSFTPASNLLLQRKCPCAAKLESKEGCEGCRKKPVLHRRAVGENRQAAVPPVVLDVLRSSGLPLDPAIRGFMESQFGHSFSQVRIHTDERAAHSAREVSALAYTVGDHIVFGAGRYAPSSAAGVGLLAHELTHVVQQQSGRTQAEQGVGSPASSYEQEADSFAERISRMSSQMRISQADSSALMRGLAQGMSEDEDTQMSVEPPDPRFLYQNGTTTCTFPAGTPSTVISNTDCSRPCTVRHEAVHFTDITPCCRAAGVAHAAAATPAAKTAVENQFFGWMSSNRSWFECRAYAESVVCADELITAKSCSSPAPADAACCSTLASYRADKEARRASNCAAAAANLSACPFP